MRLRDLTSGLMTESPVTIGPDRPLIEALALLGANGFRHLPVTDGEGRLLGILSDRDIHRALAEPATDPSRRVHEMSVAKVMTGRDLATATPLTTLLEAARMLLERKVSALPVLDGERVVGILTTDDILRAFIEAAARRPS